MKKILVLISFMFMTGLAASADNIPRDCDNNPPGRIGGRGTNWENPRGPVGGPGYGRRWRDNDNNPPGRIGGRGTNWEKRRHCR